MLVEHQGWQEYVIAVRVFVGCNAKGVVVAKDVLMHVQLSADQ